MQQAATDFNRNSAPRKPTPPPKPFIKKAVGFVGGASVVKSLASPVFCQPTGRSCGAAPWQALRPKKGQPARPRNIKRKKASRVIKKDIAALRASFAIPFFIPAFGGFALAPFIF
jgi:hypothetical protein